MQNDKNDTGPAASASLAEAASAGFDELDGARKQGLFGRLSERFNNALHQSRGKGRRQGSPVELRPVPTPTEEVAQRRARNVNLKRMVIPEGVIIEGSLAGGSETEVAGKVEGDVHVEGALYLLKSSIVTGAVHAGSCQLDGLVEGKVEVSADLVVGKTGKLNADAMAGRNVEIAGLVNGNVATGQRLRLLAGATVNGDIKARVLYMEDGAYLNGYCTMRAPVQKENGNNGKDNLNP